MHEVGYTIAALGGGRFAFHRPDGVRLPESRPPVDIGSSSPNSRPIDGHTSGPTWAGERLDIDMLVHTLAANTINASGRDLSAVPHDELSGALREAAQWPLATRAPKAGSLTAA